MKYFFISALFLIIFSCNNAEKPHEDTHGHDHGGDKVKITAYSDKFEVFAEADKFIIGKNADILAHFTWLENFKPLKAGKVTSSLIVKDKGIRQTIEKPLRSGIYSFSLMPETAGLAVLIFDINTEGIDYRIICDSITVFASESEANKIEESEPSGTTVTFTKEQSWKVDFATAKVSSEAFGQVIKTSALVESSQGDEIVISAKTSGIVLFSGDNLVEGNEISGGQKMLSISGNGLVENNSDVKLSEAKSRYERASSDYERNKELLKNKIVTERDFQASKSEYESAKAAYENFNRNYSNGGVQVSSPFSGFIKQLYVKNGQYVEAGQPLASVSQNKKLILKAEVQQKYAPFLGSVNTANIKTIHDSKIYTLEELNGKFISFGKSANSSSYLLPLSLQIDNKGSFISGSYVELYLKTISNTNAITIPVESLTEEQGVFYVFVQVNPELFEKREVATGTTDGLKVEILKGLGMKDRIVTKGAMLVKLAQSSGALDAHSGHVH